MFQGPLENVLRPGGDGFVLKPQHQFVIQIQAADVEVAGADVSDAVGDDQLRVQDLRLIFIDLHARLQQTMIQTARRQLGNQHVRPSGQDQLNPPAIPRRAPQVSPHPPGRQKIGGDDPDLACQDEIVVQGGLEGAGTPARMAEQ